MSQVNLNVVLRSKTGKETSKKSRKAGKIPATYYASDVEPKSFLVDSREFLILLQKSHNVVKLTDDTGFEHLSIIRNVQYHPVKDVPIHIDFFGVTLEKKVRVKVKFELTGTSVGVKMGGTLFQTIHKLDIECLPQNIPEKLFYDVTKLNIGSVVHVSDLNYEGIQILTLPRRTVIRVQGKGLELVEDESGQQVVQAKAAPAKPVGKAKNQAKPGGGGGGKR
ncbi:50S ribosomal protein L25 [bacterium]|nr:50S ribosomal protein L25 [bacterium]